MTQVVEIPIELAQFQLPPAVHDSAEPTLRERLHFLLDRQDAGTQLSEHERLEADGLIELAEFLSLLKLQSHQVTK
jgi:hypothetical protein